MVINCDKYRSLNLLWGFLTLKRGLLCNGYACCVSATISVPKNIQFIKDGYAVGAEWAISFILSVLMLSYICCVRKTDAQKICIELNWLGSSRALVAQTSWHLVCVVDLFCWKHNFRNDSLLRVRTSVSPGSTATRDTTRRYCQAKRVEKRDDICN